MSVLFYETIKTHNLLQNWKSSFSHFLKFLNLSTAATKVYTEAMETVEKKAAANANDVVIPIADAKDEYLSSRRSRLSTSKSSASPAHARGADLVEETTQLLTSPAANNNNNKFTDSTGEVNLESYSD